MILSVQLYTLREPMGIDPEATLRALPPGLRHVELAGTYGMAPGQFRALLDAFGLEVTGSHLGLEAFEGDLDQVIADHRQLRCDTLILPWIGEADYADGWPSFARRLDAIAERLSTYGMAFAYHNHAFEFENDGLRQLFSAASPAVKSELDLAWVQHAGHDPAGMVRELGSRLAAVHLKDTKGLQEHEDVIAGEGVVDWDSALAACIEVGVPVGVIEMDNPPGDPVEGVQACYEFYVGRMSQAPPR